jgi:hypothetical protein
MVDDVAPFDVEPSDRTSWHAEGEGLCHRFVEQVPVTGASISVVGGHGQLTIGASDPVAARVEELQFELGEGPHREALSSGRPVLVPELSDAQTSRWPVLSPSLAPLGVSALFAFPLTIGAATVGVVDMYRSAPGDLGPGSISTALALASWTAGPALRLAAQSAKVEKPATEQLSPGIRREVHQATGIIVAQLGISATEAFSRLQAYAFSGGKTLEYVAHEVVARRINFREMSD